MLFFLVLLCEFFLIYLLPFSASLVVLSEQKPTQSSRRWLLHWLLVIVSRGSIYSVFSVFPENIEYFLRIGLAFGLFFVDKILADSIYGYIDLFVNRTYEIVESTKNAIK